MLETDFQTEKHQNQKSRKSKTEKNNTVAEKSQIGSKFASGRTLFKTILDDGFGLRSLHRDGWVVEGKRVDLMTPHCDNLTETALPVLLRRLNLILQRKHLEESLKW